MYWFIWKILIINFVLNIIIGILLNERDLVLIYRVYSKIVIEYIIINCDEFYKGNNRL